LVIGGVDVFDFLLLLNVRVMLALLLREVNFAFGTLCNKAVFFFSDENLSKFDTMSLE